MPRRELTVMRQHTLIYILHTSAKYGNHRPRETVIGNLPSILSVLYAQKRCRRKNLVLAVHVPLKKTYADRKFTLHLRHVSFYISLSITSINLKYYNFTQRQGN